MKKKYLSMAKAGALFCILVLCPVDNAQAASFDCDKATTKVEKMICGEAGLSKLDEELAKAHQDALPQSTDTDIMQQRQRDWLKERDQCEDTVCLKKAYEERKAILASTASTENRAISDKRSENKDATTSLPASPESGSIPIHSQPNKYIYEQNIYKEQKDTDLEVCADLVKNLDMVHPSKASFNSEVRLDLTMKQFSLPEWQELKIEDHWREVYTIENYLDNGWKFPLPANIPSFEEWFKGYQDALQKGFLSRIRNVDNFVLQRSLHPNLRMAKVRFEIDGPIRTVMAYTRERHNFERQMEWEDLNEKCPLDKKRTCLDPKDEGLDKRFYAKWGDSFSQPGDHIFFYNLDTKRLSDIGVAELAASDQETNLILHNGRAYFVVLYEEFWNLVVIDRVEDPSDGKGPDAYGETICKILINP